MKKIDRLRKEIQFMMENVDELDYVANNLNDDNYDTLLRPLLHIRALMENNVNLKVHEWAALNGITSGPHPVCLLELISIYTSETGVEVSSRGVFSKRLSRAGLGSTAMKYKNNQRYRVIYLNKELGTKKFSVQKPKSLKRIRDVNTEKENNL